MDIEIKVPDIGIDSVEVIEILVNLNDYVEKDQSLIVVEGEKTSMEVPSPYSGIVKEMKVNVSDIVKTNAIIMIMAINDSNNTLNTAPLINTDDKNINIPGKLNIQYQLLHASPLVRRLSRVENIDLQKIKGTGRKNRITKTDIETYLANLKNNNQDNTIQIKNTNYSEHISEFGKFEEIKLNTVKRASGNLLSRNWSNIPHVTQFDESDITKLEKFRQKYNTILKNDKEMKLTILPFIIKVVCKALEVFPYFNSSISSDLNTIYLKKYINIGFAVDTSYGLMVPVIKDVKNKSISDISNEIFIQSNKAREKKLTISDMQGGCFTISNLGGIGGTYFSPIINASEAAILGISKSCYKPVWNGKTFVPKLMLPLSLSYDHRIVDGADAARFISYINKVLCDIRLLLI